MTKQNTAPGKAHACRVHLEFELCNRMHLVALLSMPTLTLIVAFALDWHCTVIGPMFSLSRKQILDQATGSALTSRFTKETNPHRVGWASHVCHDT
jgi:hypothetical protein